jgi:ATP-binding cassette subfamily F protein 3
MGVTLWPPMKVLLQARDVGKHYGSVRVLENATAAFGERMKVGVIGRNGAGKSTLCRILIGAEEADDGEVVRSRDLRLGAIEQHDPWTPGERVMEFLLRRTGREEWICGRAAARFALKHEVLEAPVDSLPGGFRTRVKLAAMVAMDPNFLVLDEPTNFLDLSTQLLLEEFLEEFPGGALVVSHDREFIKRTCDHTLEVERGGLTLFPGPLETWFEFKEVQLALAKRTNAVVQQKKAQLQEFVDRFGAKNTKATQAKSKMKEMARLQTIKIEHSLPTARIRIPPAEPRKGIAFSMADLGIGYPERRVASHIHLDIERGSKVAIVGDNGQGKTTLLKVLAGELEPLAGRVKRGHGVDISYYAQHVYQSLDQRDTVLSHIERGAAFGQTRQDSLAMAGSFLFRNEDVDKPVTVLSGGERARLCLAGLLMKARSVLLLDEPTNHLDFETVEALGEALRRFDGTVVFISHDRTFVSMVATEILEVDGGHVRRRSGSYGDYVEDLDRRVREDRGAASGLSALPGTVTAAPAREKPRAETGAAAWEERKKRRSERAKAASTARKAEERLRALERERDRLAGEARARPSDAGLSRTLYEAEVAVTKAEESWLEAQARAEALGEE